MFHLIALLAIALHCTSLRADELGMIINGKSFHTSNEEGGYNEENWGTGIQYGFDALPNGWRPFLSASGFVDSYGNNSYYAGGGYTHRINALSLGKTFTTSIGGTGFVMSREFKEGTRLLLGVLPVLTIDMRYLSFNITYVPDNPSTHVPVYFIQAVLPIDEM